MWHIKNKYEDDVVPFFHFTYLLLTKLQPYTSENVNQLDDQQVSGWFRLTDIINKIKKK